MSSPESPSSSHPARAAGFALLGVALIALVIGVFTLFSGGDDDTTATGTSSSSQPPASSSPGSASAPASETPTGSSAEQPPATTSAAPTTTTQAPAASTPAQTSAANPPPGGQPTAAKPPVRIYNNSTIAGLAARVKDDVTRSGWEVTEASNYSEGQIPTTTVYFRPGTEEEESAKSLAAVMQARVEARFDGIQAAHPGIIVIVTNDYKGTQNVK